MALILAVEPDRRQAKQLSSLMRQHVRAELVVADSGASAVEALANRIPDLILTPPLLPPKDEAVLTGWLRELGDAAAHVQTLAIPILAEASGRSREHGSSIFGRLRDQQPDPAPGCDPGVFADQVRMYLDRAGVERSTRMPEPAAAERVMATADDSAADEEFEDVTFDDLVFEPGASIEPAPAPAPVADPPVPVRMPTPFAKPEKRVDQAVLRSWEAELGIETAQPAAPPLWKVDNEEKPATEAARVRDDAAGRRAFDPDDALYAPLFRRLDELAAIHA